MRNELINECLRIRMVEEKIIELYPSDHIQSPVHLSIGQEAVAVGVSKAMNVLDLIFINYRGHAYYLARNGCLKKFFAELFGKATGVSKGKAGSMHLAHPQTGVMGASAVVASSISNAVGAALAANLRATGQVVVVVFGDGATEQGAFHESLNFAALKKLPILFVCEDNNFAVHTRKSDRESYNLSTISTSYGIPSKLVLNGYDPMEVYEVTKDLIDMIKLGSGPQFLTVKTARYYEHVGTIEDFNAGYRSADELLEWKSLDPLNPISRSSSICEKFKIEIEAAVNFAMNSEFPSDDELLRDVY
jgi:pyruvate dehydrogenase E1 component alpha subunit